GVPRGGGGAAAVRGGRDPPSGAGPGGPRGGGGLRRDRHGDRSRGLGIGGVCSCGRRSGDQPVTPAERARAGLTGLAALAARVSEGHADDIARLAGRYVETLQGGGTLFFVGNGGSAADAQHVATEYVVRYSHNRRPLPAIALTTDTSLLTACGNDLGFDEIFARQIAALARPGDLVVVHSTSGESPNVLRAAQAARAKGVGVVALLGRDGGAAVKAVEGGRGRARAVAIGGDLGDPAAAQRAVEEAARALGGLELLIVNHGVWPPDAVPVARMTDAQWAATERANLDAVLYVCRAA